MYHSRVVFKQLIYFTGLDLDYGERLVKFRLPPYTVHPYVVGPLRPDVKGLKTRDLHRSVLLRVLCRSIPKLPTATSPSTKIQVRVGRPCPERRPVYTTDRRPAEGTPPVVIPDVDEVEGVPRGRRESKDPVRTQLEVRLSADEEETRPVGLLVVVLTTVVFGCV